MIQKVEHIGVMVKDMRRSIRFYQDVIGLELVGREKLSEQVELAFLAFPKTPNVQVELVSGNEGTFPSKGVVNHIAFTVDDIDKEWQRLKELQVELIDDEPRSILGGIKIAFFYGPDNERIELFQPKQ